MKQSQLFGTTRREAPHGEESKNAILLIRGGYVLKEMAGVYAYLSLGLRVIRKISDIVREEMNRLPHTQEILMPALQPRELWEETGRWQEAIGDVLYTLEQDSLALGPTHEEVATDLFRRIYSSYKELPAAAYQIQTKFRKEARAKSGLLRGRELLMKDLYSFHTTEEGLHRYYDLVKEAYLKAYARCGLDAIYTEAAGGMFAKYSHEFQVITGAGEDTIYLNGDGTARNQEVTPTEEQQGGVSAVEVGNIFPLNLKYSKPMKARVTLENGEETDVWMGCYGLGISRVFGTIVEVHGDLEKAKIDWPEEVAPFRVHLIDLTTDGQGAALYEELEKAGVEVLYDDRDKSAGEKFADADLVGSPIRVVVSKRSLEAGGAELRRRGETEIVPLDAVLERVR